MFTGVLAALFFIHGLITMGNGFGAVVDGGRKAWADPGLANAAWLSWWPMNLGRSWLVDAAQLGPSGYALGGLIWLASGLAFAAAGLGLFGVPGLKGIWQPLALAGGGFGLTAVGLFFHPWYAVALLINLAVLATRAGTERTPFSLPAA
jgi:hypothetical protein